MVVARTDLEPWHAQEHIAPAGALGRHARLRSSACTNIRSGHESQQAARRSRKPPRAGRRRAFSCCVALLGSGRRLGRYKAAPRGRNRRSPCPGSCVVVWHSRRPLVRTRRACDSQKCAPSFFLTCVVTRFECCEKASSKPAGLQFSRQRASRHGLESEQSRGALLRPALLVGRRRFFIFGMRGQGVTE